MPGFLCPRRRAGVCDDAPYIIGQALACRFYALGVGLGFATRSWPTSRASRSSRFYALGVGLGFATSSACACASSPAGFYALGVGLGFATASFCGLRLLLDRVSMPSVSGWGLRPRRAAYRGSPPDVFLCPRCRAGVCDDSSWLGKRGHGFLCPRCRAGVCDQCHRDRGRVVLFLCPRCRAGVCDCRTWNRNSNI